MEDAQQLNPTDPTLTFQQLGDPDSASVANENFRPPLQAGCMRGSIGISVSFGVALFPLLRGWSIYGGCMS